MVTTMMSRRKEELAKKKQVLEWACKRSNLQIQARIDTLIGMAVDKTLEEGSRLWARFEATELVEILNRRKG